MKRYAQLSQKETGACAVIDCPPSDFKVIEHEEIEEIEEYKDKDVEEEIEVYDEDGNPSVVTQKATIQVPVTKKIKHKVTVDEADEIRRMGYSIMDVEQRTDGGWYLVGSPINQNSLIEFRDSERRRLYDAADVQIAKHTDYVEVGEDPEGEHADLVNKWRIYKIAVRATQHKKSYPSKVKYPELPEEV